MVRIEKIKEDANSTEDKQVALIIEQLEEWWNKKILEIERVKEKLPPFDVDIFLILRGEGYVLERVSFEVKKFVSGGVLKVISPPIRVEGDLLISPFTNLVISNIVHPNIGTIDPNSHVKYGSVCLGDLVPPTFPILTSGDYAMWRNRIVNALAVPNYDSAYNSMAFADEISKSSVKPFLEKGGEE
ncbi:MAG: hypothetical protein DDT23_00958 [candidate division WS2 bacterium]|nr:hypothetical protein [Candidatus Lithacetigena glycinireducens]